MCRGTTCTFQVKLPVFAGTCGYRAGSVQERQNTCTVQVNLPAFLGKFTCTFFRVQGGCSLDQNYVGAKKLDCGKVRARVLLRA